MIDTTLSALGGSAKSLGSLFVKLSVEGSELVKGLKAAEGQVIASAAVMSKSALKVAGVFGGVVSGIAIAGVREWVKFDDAMRKSLSTMAGVSEGLRKEMGDTARSIALNSGRSATELATAYGHMSTAGYNAQQSMAALRIVSRFATAGFLDMETAALKLIGAQKALGMSSQDVQQNTKELARLSDVAAKAVMLAGGSVGDYADALSGRAGIALRELNIGLEEGAAVLAAWSSQNVRGAAAGGNMERILRDLAVAWRENRDIMKKYGVQVIDGETGTFRLIGALTELESVLKSVGTEEQHLILKRMGFNDRTVLMIKSLMGLSSEMRQYEADLLKAAGATQQVSDQANTFSRQLKISFNRIREMLLTIGEELTPALEEMNAKFKEATTDMSGLRESAKMLGSILVKVYEWTVLGVKGIYLFVNTTAEVFLRVARGASKVVEFIANGMVDTINAAIGNINKLMAKMPNWMGGGKSFSMLSNVKLDTPGFDLLIDAFADERRKTWDNLTSDSPDMGDVSGGGAIGELGNQAAVADSRVKSLVDSIETAHRGITELERKQLQPFMSDPDSRRILESHLVENKDRQSNNILQSYRDFNVEQGKLFADEKKFQEIRLEELKKLGDGELGHTEKFYELKTALIEDADKKVRELYLAQAKFVLSVSSGMFEDLAYITGEFAGKQSGIYKAMFTASKAFAIAESIIKIQQGIANAASMPWPANLAAMASVVSATASIVSNIKAVSLQFGGAREKGGPVSGNKAYLVGERGPEMFVPNGAGRVVPNDGLGAVRLVINNYTDAMPEVSQRYEGGERVVEVLIKRVKQEIGSEIREGRGDISKSLERSFNLRRGR
jgi:TP901 family phage tail tape measure protein